MSADFEKDEIQDSPFPVEFNDDSVPIDMYGVWVKSGPRDAVMPETEVQSRIAPSGTEPVIPVPPEEYPDLPDLPDLPDFDAEESPSFASVPDFSDIPDEIASNETPSAQEAPVAEENFPVIEFDEVVNDAFPSQSVDVADVPQSEAEPNVVIDEFTELPVKPEPDEYPIEPVSLRDETAEIDLGDFLATEEIPLDETAEEVIADTAGAAVETGEPVTSFEEITAADFIDETAEIPDFAVTEQIVEGAEKTDAELSAFENDVSFEIDSLDSGDKGLPSDDDFSSFLDDLNSGDIPDSSARESSPSSGSPSDDLDLDAFINSVNETGAPSKDTERVFDDQEPINIDLEFDESFIEDVEKIRATGASVSEAEFENSEFGVEMIDETALPPSDDIDALFASATEKAIVDAAASPEKAPIQDGIEGLEVTNEFDDLLGSLDLAPAPAAAQGTSSSFAQRARTYSLNVTEEDGNDTIASTVSDSSLDDDIDVPLFGAIPATSKPVEPAPSPVEPVSPEPVPVAVSATDPELVALDDFELPPEANMDLPEEENLDIPEIRDYNETESGQNIDGSASPMEETVSPDFDDISAVEKELNDFVPEAGEEKVVTNDKSTELLMLIANELSSIKNEITTLKTEFAGYKAMPTESSPEIREPEIPVQKENSGFFSDDDTDETIALTGDELNNILITADFTEEKSLDDESVAPEGDTVDSEMPSGSIDVVAPTFDADGGEEVPETLPDGILDAPDFEASFPPVDVSHVTTVEDETGYLEGSDIAEPDLDNVAIEEPDLEIIDFEDEKLEEPELAEFNLDLSEIESEFPAEQEVSKSVEVDVSSPVSDFMPPEPEAVVTEDFTESAVEESSVAEASAEEAPADEVPSDEIIPTVDTTVSAPPTAGVAALPGDLKDEIKSVLSYMDQLLESLPEEKIEEFARSEHFEVYKKLFEELGIS